MRLKLINIHFEQTSLSVSCLHMYPMFLVSILLSMLSWLVVAGHPSHRAPAARSRRYAIMASRIWTLCVLRPTPPPEAIYHG